MKTETLTLLPLYYRMSVLISRFFVLLIALFPLSALAANDLHLAVASNFIAPIKQIAMDFEKETGRTVQLSFGSSGKLYAQILHHAPYDIFLSADKAKPEALIEKKLALPNSVVTYAKGQIVLWSANPILATTIEEALSKAKRIAIANPKLAPYGQAAKESMQNLSVWQQVKNKIVQGENIGQTYQFVYSQNADIGFVAQSQIVANQVNGDSIAIPNHLYQDINQAGVILSRTKNTALAQAFMAFLMRQDTQNKIAAFGYAPTSH